MHSIVQSVFNSAKAKALALFAAVVVTASIVTVAPSANALTVSVGTATAVSLPAAPDVWVPQLLADGGAQNSFGVIYTTRSSSQYSIMFASQAGGAGSGGGAPGWTVTTLFSTTTNASGDVAKVLHGGVLSDGTIVIYYYDDAMKNLRCLSGAASAAPLAPVSVATATVKGIKVKASPTHVTVVFSSKTANNQFELVLASRTVANANTIIASSVRITSSTDENAESQFDFLTQGDGVTRVWYYDSLSSALREVVLDGTNNPILTGRGTIDTGVISDITAQDNGANPNGITRLVYTVAGTAVKLAVQRRVISNQCWFIQKVDDGASQHVGVFAANPTVSYIKSGNLWEARGQNGTFFDEFSESITNAQLGKVKLLSNVTAGSDRQAATGALRDRGVFLPSDSNAIGAFNWTSLTGYISNSFATALPSVDVAVVVTGSGTAVGAGDLNPADSSNAGKEGGRTDGTGVYQINVASGTTLVVSASSSPWVLLYTSSMSQVNITTLTATGKDAANTGGGDFIAISSPVINTFNIDGASQRISTFSVLYMDNDGAAGREFQAVATDRNLLISDGFTNSMNFRLVPQSAQGTAPTINKSSWSFESGAILFDHTQVPGSRNTVTLSTNTHWARFSSTDTANLPKWYTLVATTRTTAGHIMQGYLVDALNLRPIEIAASSVAVNSGGLGVQPGVDVQVSTAQVNTSVNTTFIMRSSFTNTFSAQISTNLYLTQISTGYPGGVFFTTDIPLFGGTVYSNSTMTASAALSGASAGSWYIRYSSRPTGAFLNNPQFAFSPAITITSAAITSVAINDGGGSAVVSATGTTILSAVGRGFIATSSVTFSTCSASTCSDYLLSGVPKYPAGTLSYTVVTSTSMIVTINNINANVKGGPFTLYFSTTQVPGPSGTWNNIDHSVFGSTVLATSEQINATGAITVGTATIVSISPSQVTNTRTWTLTLRGRGLLPGSTVAFFATDGSTWTPAVSVNETGAAANLSSATLTATVDFRNPALAGKSFYVVMTSAPVLGFSSMTINQSVTLSVSSMSVAINYPNLNGQAATGIYNSTAGYVTVGLVGQGLVAGSTVSFSLIGASTLSAIPTGSVSSTGAFAAFASTAFHNATASNYVVTVTSLVQINGGPTLYSYSSTATMVILAAQISSVTLTSHTNAYTTLQQATYSVVGAGLLPNVTFYMKLNDTSDRVGAISRTTTSADFSSLTVTFDLRAATTTSSSWVLTGESGGVIQGSTVTLVSSGAGATLTISTIPTISVVSSTNVYRPGREYIVPISGEGLVLGTSVQLLFSGSDLPLGTTQFVSNNTSTTTVIIGQIVSINGPGVPSQSSGTVSLTISTAVAGTWRLQMINTIAAGNYGGTAPQHGRGVGAVAYRAGGLHQSNTADFTVTESSAPNAPTGLTVLSAGTQSVTLRWVSPGDDGVTNALVTGAKYVVYYASGEADRGTGCVPCYPLGAIGYSGTTPLQQFTTNFTFANTWAQFLRRNQRDASILVSTGTSTAAAGVNISYASVTGGDRGITVSTQVIAIANVTVKTSTSDAGSTGATSIPPGRLIEATLTIDPGTNPGTFWFAVRAIDESDNISPTDVVYDTASAVIGATAGATLKAGDPTIDPNKDNTVTYSITEVVIGGVTLKEAQFDTPAGALDGADSFATPTVNTTPEADAGGTEGVGASLDVKLNSGNTEFKKPITLTFTVDEGQLISKLAGRPLNLVKLAFWNGSRWVVVRESSLKPGGKVQGSVTHLTSFRVVIAAPVTSLNQATVYPNPYRPSLATHLSQGVTFDLLPANSDIKIYTLAGVLVRSLSDSDGDGVVAWNAKNEDGQDVASGVYFALLKSGGETKTLKVAVQR